MVKILISSDVKKLEQEMYKQIDISKKEAGDKYIGNKYILSPEFKTNYYEKNILKKSNGINLNIDILSFARLPYMIFKNTKYSKNIYVDKLVRNIYIKQILQETDLKILNSDKYLEEIEKVITKLKENAITPEILEEKFNLDITKEYLTLFETKLLDIVNILKKYNEKNTNTIDKEEIYLQILENEELLKYFNDAEIHILGFVGFSNIQRKLISKISKYAKKVNIYIPLNDINSSNETYSFTKNTIFELLKTIQIENDVKILSIDENLNTNISKNRYTNISKLKYMLSKYSIYEYVTEKDLKYTDVTNEKVTNHKVTSKESEENIDETLNILKFNNLAEEVRYVAEDIYTKLQKGEERDSIQLIVQSPEKYKNELIKEFNKKGLTLNITKKENIYKGELIRIVDYLISALNLDVFQIIELLKTKLFNNIFKKDSKEIEEELNQTISSEIDIYAFEKYINNWKINKYNIQKSFKYAQNSYRFLEIENIRESILKELRVIYSNIFKKENSNKEIIEDIEDILELDILELKNKKTNGKNISKAIYDFLERYDVFNNMYKNILLSEEEKQKYTMQINILNNILEKLSIIDDISVEEYSIYFKMILQNYDTHIFEDIYGITVNNIQNAVVSKYIYVLGVDEFTFPAYQKTNRLLNEEDNLKFKENEINIFKTDEEYFAKEQLEIVNLIHNAENIYLSWSAMGNGEKSIIEPSIYIDKILSLNKYFDTDNVLRKQTKLKNVENKLNTDLQITDIISKYISELYSIAPTKEELVDYLHKLKSEIVDLEKQLKKIEVNKVQEKNNITQTINCLKELYNLIINNTDYSKLIENSKIKNMSPKLNEEILSQLYSQGLKTSISKLEEYAKCPFAYYLKYILNLKEQNTISSTSIDIGIFIHEVMQKVVEDVKRKVLKIDTISKNMDILTLELRILANAEPENISEEVKEYKKNVYDNVEKNVNEILKDKKYEKMIANPKNIQITKKIVSNIKKSAVNILEFIRLSEFEVVENEKEFNQKYSIYVPSLDKEIAIELKGKIDRIDALKNGNEFRIIDYKSSNKSLDKYKIMSGLQLQLFTYANSIKEQEKLDPTGLIYMPLMYNKAKVSTYLEEEGKLQQEKNNFKFTGLIKYDDKEELSKYDTTLITEDEKSDVIKSDIIKLNKSGKISNKDIIGVTKQEYEELSLYSKNVLEELSRKIFEGNTDIYPYMYISGSTKESACKYCIYKNICKKQKENKFRYIINKDKLK
ncbi:MAG: PD-(D/E)XK nuclease family protein [Clostridium sp.]